MSASKDVSEGKEPTALQSLDRYWFDHGSPTAIGLFRIFMGTLAFINFMMIGLHWDSWFAENGYVPSWLGQMFLKPTINLWDGSPSIPRIDLINGITDPRITASFFLIGAIAALFTTFGLWTRASTIVLAIVMVSLHHRNAAILHGGDTVLRLGILYLAIAPSGLACSVDRLRRLWKGEVAPIPVRVSMWPQRLIAYNVALVYFTTVWLKMDGIYWRNGLATWFPARLGEFFRFPVPAFMNQLPIVKVTTYGTLLVEFALGTIVFFRPARKYVLLAGLLLHAYIEYSMNVPLFSYLMVSGYIAFYDGDEIAAWAERLGHRLPKYRTTVRFPLGTQLKPAAAAFLDATDPFKLVTYAPSDDATWKAERADGTPMPVGRASWTRSVGTWPFAWIPGLWQKLLNASTEEAIPEVVEEPIPTNASRPRGKARSNRR